MSKTAEATEAQTSAPAKRKGKKKLLMIVALVLVVGGGAAKVVTGSGEPGPPPAPKDGDIVDVGPMTVNLSDPQRRFARLGLALVLSDRADSNEIAARVALFKDAAIGVVARHSSDQLRTGEGQQRLREELREAAVELYGEEVLRVVLTEVLVE